MISVETHGGKEIFVIDFSDCKESEMVDCVTKARDVICNEGKPQLILAIFSAKNYITPKFMSHFNSYRRNEVIPFLRKQALIGITGPRRLILKGVNFISGRDIQAFDTRQEAIDYLIAE